jgi:archaellum component FlaG (FlaF/FlaG flagellin family)
MWPHPLPPGWYPDPRGVPGQAYWDGEQWQFPPARRKRSPLKTFAIAGVVIVGAVVLSILSPLGQKALHKSKSTHGSEQSSQSAATQGPQSTSHVTLNQEARDGNLSFVVTAVDTAQQTVNVHLTVKNVSNRSTVFWAANQRVWIAGRWFMPDKAAATKAGASSVKLEPGKSATVVVPFNIPDGNTTVDTIELNDSGLTAGITVVPRP